MFRLGPVSKPPRGHNGDLLRAVRRAPAAPPPARRTRPGSWASRGALATGAPGQAVSDLLAVWRDDGSLRPRDRFRRAVDDGALPPETDPGLLPRHVTAVAFGIAVRAAGGTGCGGLQETADAAPRGWPS